MLIKERGAVRVRYEYHIGVVLGLAREGAVTDRDAAVWAVDRFPKLCT